MFLNIDLPLTADLTILQLLPHLLPLHLHFTLQEDLSGVLGSVSAKAEDRTATGAHVRSRPSRENVKQEANIKPTSEGRKKSM